MHARFGEGVGGKADHRGHRRATHDPAFTLGEVVGDVGLGDVGGRRDRLAAAPRHFQRAVINIRGKYLHTGRFEVFQSA